MRAALEVENWWGDLIIPIHLRLDGIFYLLDPGGNFFRSKDGKSGGAAATASAGNRYWEIFQMVLDGHTHPLSTEWKELAGGGGWKGNKIGD